jgi:hypothetical protein
MRWVLVVVALLLLTGVERSCPKVRVATVHVPDVCPEGPSYLRWPGGEVLVFENDCVELPHNIALTARTCGECGCSDVAQVCDPGDEKYCWRRLNFLGGVRSVDVERFCAEGSE